MERQSSSSPQPDFFVDTKSYCFLCLNKILRGPSSVIQNMLLSFPSSIHSFQYVSHYLEMDKRKVFNEKVPIPPHLLAKVQKSKLKVALCRECGSETERFSKLYRELERVRMEVTGSLGRIHGKMVMAEETGLAEEFGKLAEQDLIDYEKINIVQRVRKEAVEKCAVKLRKALPRVAVKKFTQRKRRSPPAQTHPSQDQDVFKNVQIKEENVDGGGSQADFYKEERISLPDVSRFHHNVARKLSTEMIMVTAEVDPLLHSGSEREESEPFQQSEAQDQDHGQALFAENFGSILERTLLTSSTSKPVVAYGRTISSKYKRSGSGAKFPCNICGKFFTRPNLKRHYESIHLKQRYCCDLCPKSYSQAFHLKTHRLTHFGIVKMTCKNMCRSCGRRFAIKSELQSHLSRNSECAGHNAYVRTREAAVESGGHTRDELLNEIEKEISGFILPDGNS